jgi:tetratricopeptide (TPR) repeat protein
MRLRWLGLVGLLAGCAGFPGCTPVIEAPQDEQQNPFYKVGKERVQARDFAGAIEAFEKAIQVNPGSALAHFELGLLQEQHKFDYAAAIYHYNKVIEFRGRGYPADNARVRIPVCKQELAKSQAMESIVPSLPRQFERLRDENERLLRVVETQKVQIVMLQSNWLAARTALASNQAFIDRRWPAMIPGSPAGRPPVASAPAERLAGPVGSPRTHRVREGETLAAIARTYHLRLELLTAANPGVNPRRLRAGQTLTLPSP